MAEYIKREDAKIILQRAWIEDPFRRQEAFDELNSIPSADVAEVVRCKDCKNNYVTTHNHGKQDDPRCDFTDRHLSLADFCSRGERKKDGGT